MAVPYTFGSATSAIPLSQLDSNFATTITLGNTAIQLGNTVTTLNNMTLGNVTITSGTSNISANVSSVTGLLPEANGGTGTTTGYYGFKNRIINGAMMIDQRNGGSSVSTPVGGGGASTYGVDRFALYNQIDGGFSVQQVSDAPAGLKYSLKVTTTSAASGSPASNALAMLNQAVEAYNISDINEGTANAQSLTLSFWVKSSLTGSFTVTAENNNDRTFLTTYTISAANTWEKKTVVIPPCVDGTWNVTNGRGIVIRWGLLGGSAYQQNASASWQSVDGKYFVTGTVALAQTLNATLQITGVQLEKGSTATSFDFRSIGTELQLCQRYCYIVSGSSTYNQGYARYPVFGNGVNGAIWYAQFPVQMRTTPSMVTSNFNGSTTECYNYSTSASVTPAATYVVAAEGDVWHHQINFSFTSGVSSGQICSWRWINQQTAYIGFTAEL